MSEIIMILHLVIYFAFLFVQLYAKVC